MRRPVFTVFGLILLIMSFFIPITRPASAHTSNANIQAQPATLADFPTVDPNYIYDQLFYMATSFQHREAGYDNNLPVTVNGHDELAFSYPSRGQHPLTRVTPIYRHNLLRWRTFPRLIRIISMINCFTWQQVFNIARQIMTIICLLLSTGTMSLRPTGRKKCRKI